MAKAKSEEITTKKITLELDSLEASVLSAILCKDTGYESADDILGALTEAGVRPFGELAEQVFAPLAGRIGGEEVIQDFIDAANGSTPDLAFEIEGTATRRELDAFLDGEPLKVKSVRSLKTSNETG